MWPGTSNMAAMFRGCFVDCFVVVIGRNSFDMIRYSHGQTAFCSYVLDQMALHVYLQKVICGKNETSLVHVRFLSGIGCESIAIFKHKNVHTMHFLVVFKLFFEKKGGGIFGDHNLPSGDQKFILDRQLALVLKS